MTDPLWSTEDVLKYLRIGRTTLYWLTKRENFPYINPTGSPTGPFRYRKADIDVWLSHREQKFPPGSAAFDRPVVEDPTFKHGEDS